MSAAAGSEARTEGGVEARPSACTVVAAGTELQGTLVASVAVVVEGQFVGEVRAPELTVAAGAAVRGRIEVERLDSAGHLRGEVRARRARLTGRIEDGTVLRADSLDVPLDDDGGVGAPRLALGRCTLEVGAEGS